MSFYPQPNDYVCGPFALKNAFATLGIFADENQISKLSGTRWWSGTDEIQLARAAKKYHCSLKIVRRFHDEEALRELRSYLKRGIPCLLCIDDWHHWVTVIKEQAGKFILMDSKDKAVLTIYSWRKLRSEWVYYEQDDMDEDAVQTIFDFLPVEPQFRVQTKAKFSVARANYLRRPTNRELARHWDQYVSDLLYLCKPRTKLSSKVISLGEFFRRHEGIIIDQIDMWHGSIDQTRARRMIRNLHFVADTYGLVIHHEDEKRAIAGITAILTLWAAQEYGVGPIYSSNSKR